MPSEIVHDWTHYNRWVDMVGNRVGRRPPTDWWTIAKAAAVCVVAVGTAVALMLWAWRDPKLVVPDVKVRVEQPIVQAPLPPPAEQPVRDQAHSGKLIRNYVLFTERAMPGVGSVVTGWKFDSQNNPLPIEQWCYLSPLYGEEIGTMQRIDLPRFSAAPASAAALRRHQLTSTDLEKARQSCVWFQG